MTMDKRLQKKTNQDGTRPKMKEREIEAFPCYDDMLVFCIQALVGKHQDATIKL